MELRTVQLSLRKSRRIRRQLRHTTAEDEVPVAGRSSFLVAELAEDLVVAVDLVAVLLVDVVATPRSATGVEVRITSVAIARTRTKSAVTVAEWDTLNASASTNETTSRGARKLLQAGHLPGGQSVDGQSVDGQKLDFRKTCQGRWYSAKVMPDATKTSTSVTPGPIITCAVTPSSSCG